MTAANPAKGDELTLTGDQLKAVIAAAVAEALKAPDRAKEPAPLTARAYRDADMVDRVTADGLAVRIPKAWVGTPLEGGYLKVKPAAAAVEDATQG